ncbi:T9SS type A sorting domain-containing protein [uncultured Psychroserpens sp.]|uniref:T9SS type A sorting domain-containing protein n=1 Tax=uncultured Psychroserpens sp. TaxID=255436 RepID=UPI00260901CE|nr:T9SS type A sorting domain-containing protein [uncultured Psychroserpens sp.]
MKKITLLFFTFLAFTISNAQDTCATALAVTAGTTTVAAVDGTDIPLPECAANAGGARSAGEWFSFTATTDGVVNINTNLPANAGGDTRLHVYEGACGALTCIAGSDDVDVANMNYLSNATFPVTNGTTYIFAFDDRWDAGGFDFELTETPVDCSTNLPYSYSFGDINTLIACYTIENVDADGAAWGLNNGNDLDGDGTNDSVGLIFPPNPTVTKDDWLFLPVFNGVNGTEYSVTVNYNALDNPVPANESFDIVILDAPSSTAASQSVIGSYSNITAVGTFGDTMGNDPISQAYTDTATYTPMADGDFYVGIHATTPVLSSGILFLFSVEVDAALSVNEFDANTFTHSYNKDTDDLTLNSSSLPLDNIELYNILGQQVINKQLSQNTEVVGMAELQDGVYLAKVTIQGKTQTIKILKQ